MNLTFVIDREALVKKGEVYNGKIIIYPKYARVCFTHAVLLANKGVLISEEIVDDEVGMCKVCTNAISVSSFTVSINDEEKEYEIKK